MKKSENPQEHEKAPDGSIPPVIAQPVVSHVCILPAKPKPAFTQPCAKSATAPPNPKPEPTMEQKVADEVERRLRDRSGNFLLAFLLAELLGSWWDQHHHKD